MKRPSHRTGKVACQYKRILSSVSTHSNGGRKLHGRSKRKQPDTIELIKLSETICVTIKEGKINQMLQASIVFTLRWVGLRDGREFEQSFQMWGKFYFLIWIPVQFWKLTMLLTLDLCSRLSVLLITNGYIKVD